MAGRLERFVQAQANSYDSALSEVRRGRKVSHWMWYIFPQVKGLGHSPTALYYAIAALDEAREYLAHPVLGPRLREITQAMIDCNAGADLRGVLGYPDNLKFCSCMTLFDLAADDDLFSRALAAFNLAPDPLTQRLV